MFAPLDRDPWPLPLTGDSSLSEVIAEFLRTTDPGAGRRELRAAISHVDAELGTIPVRAVRSRHVSAMLARLRRAGLSSRRQSAVLEALHSLFSFALARRLVSVDPTPDDRTSWDVDPTVDDWTRRDEHRPAPAAHRAPAPTRSPTPTLTMLALGARVALWTTWIVTIVFVLLLLALFVELA